MYRPFFVIVFALISCTSTAASTQLSCYWEKPMGNTAGVAGVVGKFYAAQNDALHLEIDPDSGRVSHNDSNNVQSIVLPSLALSSTRETLKVTARSPNIAGLQGVVSLIEISIDRYTLDSTMIFVMPESGKKVPVAQWVRSGQCSSRKL